MLLFCNLSWISIYSSPRHPDELKEGTDEHQSWKDLYPNIGDNKVEFADVGLVVKNNNLNTHEAKYFINYFSCGYGGFLMSLSETYPDKFSLGMEIRVKVSDFVMDKIETLRKINPGQYENVACLRTNAMKYLPNYFYKAQLSKIFFLYPDPHFKKSKHKWRIINPALLAEYAYVLKKGGHIYTVTDVEDLHVWMTSHLEAHILFKRLTDEETSLDILHDKLLNSSEEAQKVERNHGQKFLSIFRRL